MSSNDLIATMQEFGVKVELLGTLEEPSPDGLAMGAMLLEIHRLRQALAARPVATVPAWAEHVEVSIGAHRQEWMEGGQPHHNWARSCWGKGPTLESAIADMVSKPCATQEDWDATLQLNPHIAAAASGEGGEQ